MIVAEENQERLTVRCLICQAEGIPAAVTTCPQCGANLTSLLRDTLPPGTLLNGGTYQVDYVLGRGGFGITYRGKQTALEQAVAIKEFYLGEFTQRDTTSGRLLVLSDREQEFSRGLSRFEREGKTLANLSHPNVVRVLNLFNDNGTTYLVMEYLSGKTLKAVMKEGRLEVERVHQIMGSLVEALAAVHAQGVYHLDIKPANVLIEPSGRVVLIDFGAARQGISSHTTIPAYTPSYAPLEVMSAEQVGAYSDIFELGMMLHEMIAGTLPPPALDRITRMARTGDWQPDPEQVPEPWCSLVASALPLRPDDRPTDVLAWWESAMGAAPLASPRSLPGATGTSPSGGMLPGADITATAVISPAVARNGGEAAYITENNERGTFRCPPGIWDGAVHRIPGQGAPGRNGGRSGALVIKIQVRQGSPGVGSGNSGNSGSSGNSRSGERSGNSASGTRNPQGVSVSGIRQITITGSRPGGMKTGAKIALVVGVLVLLGLIALVAQAFLGGKPGSGTGKSAAQAATGPVTVCKENGAPATEFCPRTEERAPEKVASKKPCLEHSAQCPICKTVYPRFIPKSADLYKFCDKDHGKPVRVVVSTAFTAASLSDAKRAAAK